MPGRSNVNSSPPTRATVSPSRTMRLSCPAAFWSRAWPRPWPTVWGAQVLHVPLGELALGDIDGGANIAGAGPTGLEPRHTQVHDPAVLAIGSPHAIFQTNRLFGLKRRPHRIHAPRQI